MRIIKPYGRSVADKSERKIRKTNASELEPVSELLKADALVIAQWIGIIDKIIQKAGEDKDADKISDSKKQANARADNEKNAAAIQLRQILGNAAWHIMTDAAREGAVTFSSEEKRQSLEMRWREKLKARNAKAKYRQNFPQGRWYQAFVGDTGKDTLSAEEMKKQAPRIAGKIYRHLYENALAIGAAAPAKAKDKGEASHRAASISCNTLKRHDNNEQTAEKLNLQDSSFRMALYKYKNHGDVAQRIRTKIFAEFADREKSQTGAQGQESVLKTQQNLRVGSHNYAGTQKPRAALNTASDSVYILAVKELRAVWRDIFDVSARSVEAARKQDNALFVLHQAVRDSYKALLKGRVLFPEKLKARLPQGKENTAKAKLEKQRLIRQKLEEILPADINALLRLTQAKSENRELNHLIRLGRIIHYQAARNARGEKENTDITADSNKAVAQHFPCVKEVEGSCFWSSAGQTEIKQNEALVRVWRRALSFAARSLKQWADPQNRIDGDKTDILGSDGQRQAYENFSEYGDKNKFSVLFGRALPQEIEEKELLKYMLQSAAALRNAAFHFKGLGTMLSALAEWKAKGLRGNETEAEKAERKRDAEKVERLKEFAAEFYRAACARRHEIMLKNLETVQLHHYLGAAQMMSLWAELKAAKPSSLPLPRFKRILLRAENAWGGVHERLKLPFYLPRQEREKGEGSAENAQFNVLKMLYERPFKTWLEQCGAAELNAYIVKAAERSTAAARKLNAKDKTDAEMQLVEARAAHIERLREGDEIGAFFSNLTAATAAEMRVQKGYESNGEQAKKQAHYIEDLKCDVIALAFSAYLQEKREGRTEISFVLRINTIKADESRSFKYARLEPAFESVEKWQEQLYLLLYLMPVQEVSGLRQQIRRWENLVNKEKGGEEAAEAYRSGAKTAEFMQILDMYIALHDAQFVGGDVESLAKGAAESFFTDKSDFEKVFPRKKTKQGGDKSAEAEEIKHLPIRGLREMHRFGDFALHSLYTRHKVTSQAVAAWQELSARIAGKQERLAGLHEDWARSKDKKQWVQGAKGHEYQSLLKDGVQYRHLTAQVMLQEHLRLRRLLMAVLARLVDFAALFERDLYFTMLALFYKKGSADIKAEFEDRGRKLSSGQIIAAVRSLKDKEIGDRLKKLFNFDEVVEIRNNFAHFNMLQGGSHEINLTAEVNAARKLMGYDRKLKNAVSKAVMELLEREGLLLTWKMSAAHELQHGKITVKQAVHLGGVKIAQKDEKGNVAKRKNSKGEERPVMGKITEALHSEAYCRMAEALFGGNR